MSVDPPQPSQLVSSVGIMFGKKTSSNDEAASPGTKLKHEIIDSYAKGEISSHKRARMLTQAGNAKVASCQLGSSVGRTRDLHRTLKRHSGWPPLYHCEVPVTRQTGELFYVSLAFLLSHEVLHVLMEAGDEATISSREGLDHMALAHLTGCEEQVGAQFIGLGIWCDGVPVSWDRSESIQWWTWNLPGMVQKHHRQLRLPFTVIQKHYVAAETNDFIFNLLGWSLQQMFVGSFPMSKHDGTPFEDKFRQQLAGKEATEPSSWK